MIGIEFTYEMEVAHRLTAGVPKKFLRLHGHRYVLEMVVGGDVDENGILIDYEVIHAIVKPLVALIDGHDLNALKERCSTPEAEAVSRNPTAERLMLWFVKRLAILHSANPATGTFLASMRLRETGRIAIVWPVATPGTPTGGEPR